MQNIDARHEILLLALERLIVFWLAYKGEDTVENREVLNASYSRICAYVTALDVLGDKEAVNAIERLYAHITGIKYRQILSDREPE